ncbi:MAG TPA: glycosyltransferase [Acetobacteraceae bacterium]
MPSPRVLFVNHTSTGAGAELVLLDLVQAWAGASAYLFEEGPLNAGMRSRGVQVQVARWGSGLASVRRDSSLLRAVPLAGRLAATTLGLAWAARRHDVVYANSQKAFVLASAAAVLARRPLIWHLHDIISSEHFGQGQRRLQVGLANRCAARVIVPSEAAATAFTAAGGREALVHVIPNGMDLVRDPLPPQALRGQLGLPPGPLIGVFSRLAPWKGQHVVLQALARLPGVHCILAGDALFGEHAYARTLHELTRDLGIADRVQFLGQRSDVPRLMQACDAVIHSSVDPEPFGRTLIEAMLMRVPLIASDTGAPSEILEGGAAGTLVPPGDVSALAAAVAAVLANSLGTAAQLDRAEARAQSQYGVVPMRTRTVDLIGRVVAEARAGADAIRRAEA